MRRVDRFALGVLATAFFGWGAEALLCGVVWGCGKLPSAWQDWWMLVILGLACLMFLPVCGVAMGVASVYFCPPPDFSPTDHANLGRASLWIFYAPHLIWVRDFVLVLITLVALTVFNYAFQTGQDVGRAWVERRAHETLLGVRNDWERSDD